jgi:hypothetical protein
MSTPNDKPIRSSGVSGLSGPMRAGNPILRRMSEDMLRRAKACEPNEERFHLGNYTFRRPDYNQILAWARALEMDPLQLLAVLEETSWDLNEGGMLESIGLIEFIKFEVEDGSIVSLAWDFERLPILSAVWEQDLRIRSFGTDGPTATGSLLLRGNQTSLIIIDCRQSQLKILDLQGGSELMMLWCSENQLQELSLENNTRLWWIRCEDNQLAKLNLQCVPKLMILTCANNQLQALDLSKVNSLALLRCHANQIKELDLHYTPKLFFLYCQDNQLTELDLRCVPELKQLWCHSNRLHALDLANLNSLKMVTCHSNQIKELDLQCLPVLKEIWCDKDVQLLNCPEGLVIRRVG